MDLPLVMGLRVLAVRNLQSYPYFQRQKCSPETGNISIIQWERL